MGKINNSFQHLRLSYSFILMPIFLFAVSQTNQPNWINVIVLFLILHLFVYPSNQAQAAFANMQLAKCDIAAMQNHKSLFVISTILDVIAMALSVIISLKLSLFILTYLLVSKAYYSNPIRLKRYAMISLVLTMALQGAFLAALTQLAAGNVPIGSNIVMLQACSFFVGFVFPLTQMYSHNIDGNRGDYTISLRLGLNRTFTLSFVMLFIAVMFMGLHFYSTKSMFHFYLFLLFLSPIMAYFFWWKKNTKIQPLAASFQFTRLFVIITSASMGLFSLVLIFLNHFNN